jgi:hypothetical protein
MISYDFGPVETFYAALVAHRERDLLSRLFSPQKARLRFLAENLGGGPIFPDHVFWVFDHLHPDRTRFSNYPAFWLKRWCKDREFRRACRCYWNGQVETMINNVDANELDPVSAGIMWLIYLAFVFAITVSIVSVLPFALDTFTVAAILVILCFIRGTDLVIETIFGVSARWVRRGIKLARLRRKQAK